MTVRWWSDRLLSTRLAADGFIPTVQIDVFTVAKNNSAATTVYHNTGAANLAVAVHAERGTSTTPVLTWGGTTMTRLDFLASGDSLSIHYLFNPSSGNTTITTNIAEGTLYTITFNNAASIVTASPIENLGVTSYAPTTPETDGFYLGYACDRNEQTYVLSGSDAETLSDIDDSISSIIGVAKASLSIDNGVAHRLAGVALIT